MVLHSYRGTGLHRRTCHCLQFQGGSLDPSSQRQAISSPPSVWFQTKILNSHFTSGFNNRLNKSNNPSDCDYKIQDTMYLKLWDGNLRGLFVNVWNLKTSITPCKPPGSHVWISCEKMQGCSAGCVQTKRNQEKMYFCKILPSMFVGGLYRFDNLISMTSLTDSLKNNIFEQTITP